MKIRTKMLINLTAYAVCAIALAARELLLTHPDLIGM